MKRNWSVSELELQAIELCLRKMRLLTIGNKDLTVKTDHLPLLGILKKPLDKIETRRLMKLAERDKILQQIQSEIKLQQINLLRQTKFLKNDNSDFVFLTITL